MSYSLEAEVHVDKQANADVASWLQSQPQTVSVHNVEDELSFQLMDIDFIWETQQGSYQVGVKGDHWDKAGNFFFETHTNLEKGTPGSFMYTSADWLFYEFVKSSTVYMLPMPAIRNWFMNNLSRFETCTTTTSAWASQYTTVGCLVPIQDVLNEVPGVKQFHV